MEKEREIGSKRAKVIIFFMKKQKKNEIDHGKTKGKFLFSYCIVMYLILKLKKSQLDVSLEAKYHFCFVLLLLP